MEEGHRARRGLTILVAAEALAVAGLHRLGRVDGFAIPRDDFSRWLRDTPSEDVLLAGIRLLALVAAWWLLATTLLYVSARLAHLHAAARVVGWATLPAVRRWADRAAVLSIVAVSAVGAARPAAADPPPTTGPAPPPVVIDLDHREHSRLPSIPPASVRTGRAGAAQPAATVPVPETAPPVPHPEPLPVMPPAPAARTTRTITAGEHLWSIAAERVAAGTGRATRELAPDDIAPYWRRVVEVNRSRLRSGYANLVYPGEEIELPPI